MEGPSLVIYQMWLKECKLSHIKILCDYFAKHLVYDDHLFRHQYQMHHPLFLRIMEGIFVHDPYFVKKIDACDVLGLNLIQKCTSVLDMLAYNQVVDACDVL